MTPPSELSNEQVISLLNQMDIEEQSLRPLWDQFSVARRQVRVVLDRYNLAQKELPGLEERKNSLEMGILELDRDTIAKKERVRVEVSDFRSSLEEQLVGLQKELVETRERVVATNGALREAEAGRKTRIEQLNDEVRALENRRDMAKVEIDKIQQSLRVSA